MNNQQFKVHALNFSF